MATRYTRRYQRRNHATWRLSPYHRVSASGIVVVAGFGFRGIDVGDWITLRSQHYSSEDNLFSTVQVWESADGEIAALNLEPYSGYSRARTSRLSSSQSASQLEEWILHFCEDPPRYTGKFITRPVSEARLRAHAHTLTAWMDPMFKHIAPGVATELEKALQLRASAEVPRAVLDSSIAEARAALARFENTTSLDMVYRIGAAPKEVPIGASWESSCQLLGSGREPIVNPYFKTSQRARWATTFKGWSTGAQTRLDSLRRQYGLDQLAVVRAGVKRATAAPSAEDFATRLASWLEYSAAGEWTNAVSDRVRRQRLLDAARLVRATIVSAPKAYRETRKVRALDYAAFLLSAEATVDVGQEVLPILLKMTTGGLGAISADISSPIDCSSDSIRARIIKESWNAALRDAGEFAPPYASVNIETTAPEELAAALTYEPEVHERVLDLSKNLCSISYGSPIEETGLLASLSVSNPMLSESSNELSCDVLGGQRVYWTSSWESNEAAEFDHWVGEQSERCRELDVEKRRQATKVVERWRQVSEYRVPDLRDDTWTEDQIELPELETYEGELDPGGNTLVEICAMSYQAACLADLIVFLDSYNAEWMAGEGGMIQAGWRSPGCSFSTRVPELARYVELVSELYDLAGTWVSPEMLLVRS